MVVFGIIMYLVASILFWATRWYKKRHIDLEYFNNKLKEPLLIDENIIDLLEHLCLGYGKSISGKNLSLTQLGLLINEF